MSQKILHRKQKKKTRGQKILHKKQKYKQWATIYYTKNKIINNGPQNTTQKTKILTMGHKILHRKQ
jgi:hypothetical protein